MIHSPRFLASFATVRGLIISAGVTGALGLASRLALSANYRGITGFLPFDLQFPLSAFMVAVELGAFDKGVALSSYAYFAIVDIAFVLATAWLFTLYWTWLFIKSPTRLFTFLVRGGIQLLPSYIVVLDLAAKAGFFRVLGSPAGHSSSAGIEFTIAVHRLKYAVIDIRNLLTVAFLLAIALERDRV